MEFIILGMLIQESLTGYELKKCIDNGVGVLIKTSYGSIYPALQKLLKRNAISMVEDTNSGRSKKIYSINKQGKDEFMEWLVQPTNAAYSYNNHLVKVYFFDLLEQDIRNQLLLEYEIGNKNYLQKLEKLEKGFQTLENKQAHYYKLSTLFFGIVMLRQIIAWCEHVREGRDLSELI